MVKNVTRASWEPAHVKYFYAGLAAAQSVLANAAIVHAIVGTNKGASTVTMMITENGTQIGTLSVPANATAAFPVPSSGVQVQQLSVTPSAALDVTVLTA